MSFIFLHFDIHEDLLVVTPTGTETWSMNQKSSLTISDEDTIEDEVHPDSDFASHSLPVEARRITVLGQLLLDDPLEVHLRQLRVIHLSQPPANVSLQGGPTQFYSKTQSVNKQISQPKSSSK